MSIFSYITRRGTRSVLRGMSRYFFGKRGTRRVQGFRLFYKMRLAGLLKTKSPIHKVVKRSEIRFWVDGRDAFRVIEKYIEKAKHSILIEMFIWKDDRTGRRIVRLLNAAADRGVEVHITKESVGDVFEFAEDFASTKEKKTGLWHTFWRHPNITIQEVTDDNHTKAYVFDGEILLLTGMNIADEYRYTWHDYLVELRGSRFAEAFLTHETVRSQENSSIQLVLNRRDKKELRSTVERILGDAQYSIVMEMAYFSDPSIIRLLAAKSKEGVRITVILPETPDVHKHANTQSINTLLSSGNDSMIQVLEYPGVLHGKLLLVDRKIALVGSLNMMTSSLDRMGEANVLITEGHVWILNKIRTMIRGDIARSTPVKTIPKLSWLGRWLAWIGL